MYSKKDNAYEEDIENITTKYNTIKHNSKKGSSIEKNVDFYNNQTPVIHNSDKTLDELEMRKTYKMKPPLISSKLPAAFEIPRVKNKMYIYL